MTLPPMLSATGLAIRALLNSEYVTALVGQAVYPTAAPQNTSPPYIVVSLVHEDQDIILEGARDGFFSRVSISCIAGTASNAERMGEGVKECMSGILNTPIDAAFWAEDDYWADPVHWDDDNLSRLTAFKSGPDFSDYSADRRFFRRQIDYRLRWTRS